MRHGEAVKVAQVHGQMGEMEIGIERFEEFIPPGEAWGILLHCRRRERLGLSDQP